MQERTRTRIIWTLVAGTAAYALLNVILYYMGAGFGAGWLIASVLLYGSLLVAALVLGFVDPGSPARAPQPKPAAAVSEPVSLRVLYETATGRLESAGAGRAYLAATHDGVRSIDDVERSLDARSVRAVHVPEAELAAVLAAHDIHHDKHEPPAAFSTPYRQIGSPPSNPPHTEVTA